MSSHTKQIPIWDAINKVPGGLMIIPLIIGSLVRTFAPGFLGLGSFTTALFRDSALPLIALLIFATGAGTTFRAAPLVLAKSGALLLAKTFIPGVAVIVFGYIVGRAEILPGLALLSLMAALINSNGGLWIALSSKYGNKTDVGAYIASALNDGPFFTMLFLGLAGLANIPAQYLLAVILPYLIGFVLGNLDPKIGEIFKPTALITIPFFAFSLGAGIDISTLGQGALGGVIIGLLSSLGTGFLGFIVYKVFFSNDTNPAVGFGIGTTAGNAVIVPSIVAQADPSYSSYVPRATAGVATAVLITAILTPIITHYLWSKENSKRNK
jgi:2-keto-3-deoxygluconate permease